jgi:predicted PurR-regulated permease PerM
MADVAPAERPARLTRTLEIVPEWLANLAALGWRVIAIGTLAVILWLIASFLWTVTASIAVAIVIAAFLAPFVLGLRRRGMSRSKAAGIVWAGAMAVVLAAMVVLAVALLPYAADLLRALEQAVTNFEAALAAANIPPAAADAVHVILRTLTDGAAGTTSDLTADAAQVATIAILATFLVFFFLMDGDRAWLWIFQAASDQNRGRITEAGDNALARVGGYLRGTAVLASIMAVTDYAFMWLLGVPLAVPLTILVFFSAFIPYVGGIVANLVLLGVTYGALGAGPAIVLLALIAVRNAILGYGVRPAVYGRTVHLHPALVLLALPVGFSLAGIVGLFAAVPVAAIVLAVADAAVAILDPGPEPERPALVPGWLDRLAQWSVRLLVAIGLVAFLVLLLVAMPIVTVTLLLATIFAATLEPGLRALVRRGWSRGTAAGILTGGSFIGVMLVIGLILFGLVDQASGLLAGTAAGAGMANDASGDRLSILVQAIVQGGAGLLQAIVGFVQSIASAAVVVILSALLAFYFLRDGDRLWARVVARSRSDMAPAVGSAGRRAIEVLGGYMVGTGLISLVGAASQLVIMLVLGIPFAFAVFVLSFVLCFIPYIGGFISTGIAFLLTVAFGSQEAIIVMALWTVVFNLVTGNVVAPLVYGKTVHLHPAVVLVAIPAGAAIAGILGMFVVVPALGVVAVTWRTVLAVIGQRRRELAGVADVTETAGVPVVLEPGLVDSPATVASPLEAPEPA